MPASSSSTRWAPLSVSLRGDDGACRAGTDDDVVISSVARHGAWAPFPGTAKETSARSSWQGRDDERSRPAAFRETTGVLAKFVQASRKGQHAYRRSEGSEDPRIPRGAGAGQRARTPPSRPPDRGREGRRRGHRHRRRGVRAGGRHGCGERRGGLRRRRHDREGEGAAAGGDRHAARRPGAVHLSASRRRQGTDRGAAALRRDVHRLRDGDRRARRPAAAGADERGRRPHVGPGGRALPREGTGRQGRAAGRRAGREGGQGRDHRRRRVAAPMPRAWRWAWRPMSP